jgi:hypothetical protein
MQSKRFGEADFPSAMINSLTENQTNSLARFLDQQSSFHKQKLSVTE